MKIEVLERANELYRNIQEIDTAINDLTTNSDINISISKYMYNGCVNSDNLLTEDELLNIEHKLVSQLRQKKEALEKEFEDL